MGDRGNIVILEDDSEREGKVAVFLYSHWSGEGLPGDLLAALKSEAGRARRTDASYLARIIFDQMIGPDQGGETGYGISTTLTDNEWPLLVVDVPRQVVVEYPEEVYNEHGFLKLSRYKGVPFDEYLGKWKKRS